MFLQFTKRHSGCFVGAFMIFELLDMSRKRCYNQLQDPIQSGYRTCAEHSQNTFTAILTATLSAEP